MAVIDSVEVINDLGLVDEHIRVLITNATYTPVTPDWDVTDPDAPQYIANKPTKTSAFTNDGATGQSSYIEWSEVGDINAPTFSVIPVTKAETTYSLSAVPGTHYIDLKSVTINSALAAAETFIIDVGQQQTWKQILSKDDIDITTANTTYVIDELYPYNAGDMLRITVGTSNTINILVTMSYN